MSQTAHSPFSISAPHTLPADEALDRLQSRREGLTAAEAAQRLESVGPNRLPAPPRDGPLKRFFKHFHDVLIYILLGAGVITALLGHWVDTGVILGVVVINAIIGQARRRGNFASIERAVEEGRTIYDNLQKAILFILPTNGAQAFVMLANPYHFDEAYAARGMFKKRIAHGMLVTGYISTVLGTIFPGPGTIYLSQTLEFKAPVFIGDTITAVVEVLAIKDTKPIVTLRTECLNQDGKTVVSGQAVVLVEYVPMA